MFAICDRRTGRPFTKSIRQFDFKRMTVVIPDRTDTRDWHDKRPKLPVQGGPGDIFGNVAVSLPFVRFQMGGL